MRVAKLFVFGVFMVMASCEQRDSQNQSQGVLIENRFKRDTLKESDTILRNMKSSPTIKPVTGFVKPLIVRPLLAPNQIKALNPTNVRPNVNVNNIAPKQHIITKGKTISNNNNHINSKSPNDSSTKVIATKNNEKEHEDRKEPVEEVKTKYSDTIDIKEKESHKSQDTDKESGTTLSNKKSPVKLNETKIVPPDNGAKRIKALDSKNILIEKTLTNSDNDFENKIIQEHDEYSLKGKDTDILPIEKSISTNPVEIPITTSQEIITNNKPDIEIARTERTDRNPEEINDNTNKTENTNGSPFMSVLMKGDKTLKLEGGEEIVIQNNNYEELYEKTDSPQYCNTPKLINSELRIPQPCNTNLWPAYNIFNENSNNLDQYVYDDMMKRYNQYLENTYDVSRNGYNYNTGYQWNQDYNNQQSPIGHWRNYYQVAKPQYDRIWRTWRNNQMFIKPKDASHDQLNNLYGYSANGQNLPIPASAVISPNLYGNQNIHPYPYGQQSCACNLYGY